MLARMWCRGNLPLLMEEQIIQLLWKSIWQFFRKFGINLLQDTAVLPLGIYTKDAPSSNKDTSSTMFIVALFIAARNWKDHSCALQKMNKNVECLNNGVLLNCIKNDIMKFAVKQMELENIITNQVTQSRKINMACIQL